jgi:trimethylguanosine synthase
VHPEFHLSDVKPNHGKDLFKLSKNITRYRIFLSRNINPEETSELASVGGTGKGKSEIVEVEEEWMGMKLKH